MNSQSLVVEPAPRPQQSAGKNYRFFPGWTMLVIAAGAQYFSAPGQSFSVAIFKDSMRDTLALSETSYSLAYGFATLFSACLLPLVGRTLDNWGARIMLPVIASGLAISCYGMSQVESLAGLYIGFCSVRSLGQGALTILSAWIVGEWFARKRGLATALSGLGGGISVMTIPLLNEWLIDQHGWQIAWQVLGGIVATVLIIPGWFIIRNRPEDLGLHPDGVNPTTEDKKSHDNADSKTSAPFMIADEHSWSVKEVLTHATFWKLVAVPATSALVGTGLVFHCLRLLGTHGISQDRAVLLIAFQALCSTVLTFPAGWATDRFPSRLLLASAMLALSMASLLAWTMPVMGMAFIYAFLLGVNGAIFRSTGTVVWINYFGRRHQGAIRGIAWAIMIIGSALGPFPLAFSVDVYQSYVPALWLFMLLPLCAAYAVWSAHPPVKQNQSI